MTVNLVHFPDEALATKSPARLATSGNSPGVGGFNSTLAYRQNVLRRGVANSVANCGNLLTSFAIFSRSKSVYYVFIYEIKSNLTELK